MAETRRIVLARYDSRSEPGKQHEIRVTEAALVYCTCKGWKVRKTCYHLEDFAAKNPDVVAKYAGRRKEIEQARVERQKPKIVYDEIDLSLVPTFEEQIEKVVAKFKSIGHGMTMFVVRGRDCDTVEVRSVVGIPVGRFGGGYPTAQKVGKALEAHGYKVMHDAQYFYRSRDHLEGDVPDWMKR